MQMEDYQAVFALWQETEGIGLSAADSAQEIARYLARNPDLSYVARVEGEIVGAVLCGHDGRRGFIHHLAVRPAYRREGLGQALVDRCLSALSACGIGKCHVFVFAENQSGKAFWRAVAWIQRDELVVFSRRLAP
jgi:putative acetyltransferase